MQSKLTAEPIAQFCHKLGASLVEGTFLRLTLVPAGSDEGKPERVLGRSIDLKGAPHLSLTFRYPQRDEVRNIPVSKADAWLEKRLGTEFRSALLCTSTEDWQLSLPAGKRVRLIRHKPSMSVSPSKAHDQARHTLLDSSANDWLEGLGVVDRAGKVRPTMSDKHTQIHRFLEIFSHLAKETWGSGSTVPDSTEGEWTVADMGCGKGYLTFAIWHLLRRTWGWPGKVIGVDSRSDLVTAANQLAQRVGASDLSFLCGTIDSVELPHVRAFIALHACDTATDDAIRRGIDLGAELILVAPCCHKEARAQIGQPAPLNAVLRHGVMEERMAEWVTDGLRALFLEWAGYRSKVFEFVSSEHTPKNLMIAGIRSSQPFSDPRARTKIEELKSFFGITHHALDPLLTRQSG